MDYEIYCGGKLIAQFEHEMDRDYCVDTLRDINPDSTFAIGE